MNIVKIKQDMDKRINNYLTTEFDNFYKETGVVIKEIDTNLIPSRSITYGTIHYIPYVKTVVDL